MNKQQRITYHTRLWPAAARALGLDPRSETDRHALTIQIMRCCKSPALRTSDKRFRQAETTALFTALRHLAEPDNLTLQQRWADCQADYVAFHQSKQADYWQERAYGQGGGQRLTRHRFAGRRKAIADDPIVQDPIDRKTSAARLHTMRSRARAKAAA